MPGFFSRPEVQVVAVSDRAEILDALRRAADGADEAERAGLARALAVVEATPARDPAELRGRWARERIEAAGIEPKADSIVAIKALRKAEPGLSLAQAVALAKEAAATPPR
ncbi:hypothetical protein ACIQM4_07755 [Streptomyces sp. NPDC091272]|uniref:hypothetical protein n=1 Tax=Streptomyces sp. NPDC091272 TaxID=3365981 RepID=UPI003809AFE9